MSDSVLETVRTLLPGIAERARSTDENRRVPDRTIEELVGAGFFRMLQPVRFGGAESDPVEFFRVVRLLLGTCG